MHHQKKTQLSYTSLIAATLLVPSLSYGAAPPSSKYADVSGEVQIRIEDFKRSSKTSYRLKKEDGKVLELQFKDPAFASALTPGSQLRLKGTLSGKIFTVEKTPIVKSTSNAKSRQTPESTIAYGDRKTAVFILNFSDATNHCEMGPIQSMFDSPLSSINHFYHENTRGRVSFNAGTMMSLTLEASGGLCRIDEWQQEADRLASAQGVNVDSFHHVIYVLPAGAYCTWSGLGSVGNGSLESRERAWIMESSCTNPVTIAHELGHNLGWNHAATPSHEYGDTSDIMGAGGFVHSNAAHKIEAGILSGAGIQEITQGGLYRIDSNDRYTNDVQAVRLRLPNPLHMGMEGSGWEPWTLLILSYRTQEASHPGSPLPAAFVNKTSVHVKTDRDHYRKTLLLKSIGDGEPYAVLENDITVEQLSHDSSSALVCIKIQGQGNCEAPPEVTGLVLYNADTDQVIKTLSWGDELNLTTLPTRHLNIVAITNPPTIGSVRFEFNREPIIESKPPYALMGDTKGDLNAWTAIPGNYIINATPFLGKNGTGVQGKTYGLYFNVVIKPEVTSLVLYNADTDQPIQALKKGDVIQLSTLPTRNLSIVAVTSPARVGSVRFVFKSDFNYRIESQPPYALEADVKGDLNAWKAVPGDYHIQAIPYEEAGANGLMGVPLDLPFKVIE